MTPSRKASAVESVANVAAGYLYAIRRFSTGTPQEPKMTDKAMRSAQWQHDRLTPEDMYDSLHEAAVDKFIEDEMDDLINGMARFGIGRQLPLAWRHAAERHLVDALAQYIADNERAIAGDIVAARNSRVEE